MANTPPPRSNRDEHTQRQKAIDDAKESLIGLFDAVVLIGTYQTENGDSGAVVACDGNWYAQNGLMSHFLERRKTAAKIEQISSETEQRKNDDDDE